MLWVVSYDIVDNRRRLRLARLLADYGHRVQKSVFECDLDDRRFLTLKNQVERLIDHNEDSVRYYALCRRCRQAMAVSGWGVVREEDEIIIV